MINPLENIPCSTEARWLKHRVDFLEIVFRHPSLRQRKASFRETLSLAKCHPLKQKTRAYCQLN